MKTNKTNLTLRALVVAVQTALLAFGAVAAAQAADEEDALRQLTQPDTWVEVGAGYVSQDSYKFGEYNGLENEGIYGILNFFLKGGGHFDSEDATRWTVVGTNLGLDNRELQMEYGQQGRYKVELNYQELRRNRSDSYQTPYDGVGTSVLTLPSNWLKPFVPQNSSSALNFRSLLPENSQGPALVGGVLVQPTPSQLAQLNAIVANDVPAFHDEDLHTTRQQTQVGFMYQLNRNWDVRVSAENEHKYGLKPLGSVSSLIREFAAILPDRIDQDTQQYNLSVNYTDAKAFVQFGYYGSIFKNHVDSMTWADVNDPTKSATMASAPSNEFHQFNLNGGYNFSPTTKLVANASYARNTQNDSYITDSSMPLGVPVDSLDGLVVTTTFDAKLTSRPMDHLRLNVAYKYDNHDNQTRCKHLLLPGRERSPGRRGLSVQRCSRAGAEYPCKQHQHLREPALQQETEPVRP